MGEVIDFIVARKKMEQKRINLSTFNIPVNYIDAESLYCKLSDEHQDDKFLFYKDKEELFYELRHVLTDSDKKRAAWVVLDEDRDYFYLKEKEVIYIAEKGTLEKELKHRIDEFAIDYMIFVERVKSGKYRKVVGW